MNVDVEECAPHGPPLSLYELAAVMANLMKQRLQMVVIVDGFFHLCWKIFIETEFSVQF